MQSEATSTDRESHDQAHGIERYWMQKMWDSPAVGSILDMIQEAYLRLTSPDFLWHSLSYAKRSLAESPCSTLLTVFLVFFGFLPLICFFLFICGTFILWLVCFIFCQAIALTFAGALFGGMFFFIIIASCIMATAFGMTIHTLSLFGRIYRVIYFNAPEAIVFLRQQLDKFGIHLRLPDDDQA